MSLLNNQTKLSKIDDFKVHPDTFLAQLPVYVVCVVLGLFSGAVGVAVAIGAAIIIEIYFVAVSLAAAIVPMALGAVAAGLGVAWLLSKVNSKLFHTDYTSRQMQVIFILSALTAILQTFIYMQGV